MNLYLLLSCGLKHLHCCCHVTFFKLTFQIYPIFFFCLTSQSFAYFNDIFKESVLGFVCQAYFYYGCFRIKIVYVLFLFKKAFNVICLVISYIEVYTYILRAVQLPLHTYLGISHRF